MSGTPKTDDVEFEVVDVYDCRINVVSSCLACTLERELSNMTDQRDAALQALEWAKKSHERELAEAKKQAEAWEKEAWSADELVTQRDKELAEAREQRDNAIAELEAWRSEKGPDGWWVKHEEYVAQRELLLNAKAEVEQQRDRLAEALEKALKLWREDYRPSEARVEYNSIKQALAAVKGGSHE